ncbi:DUF6133 family protein [Paludicola sp. MB14-C6]|uniref:DUF6133 family protein n=1 Tax=Paludihabitans sp. MB14-C6 TaxID=3070656 RepID=UPI0027DC1FB7|nr:DUF6133 family protein [Paludicola sp. MB14-C6]WMJ22694.1 DUF6133 family protein [Paludicola sp. MB14-C6]
MFSKISKLLHNKNGVTSFFQWAIGIAIVFVLGAIILKALSAAFRLEILPSLIEQIKDILTW